MRFLLRIAVIGIGLPALLAAQGRGAAQTPGNLNPDGSLRPRPPVTSLFTQDAYTEYALLELFLEHPRQVLTRSQIFERVWGYDFGSSSNSLGVYMGYLRRKTEAGGKPRLIQTIRGVGYALREAA